MIDEKTVKRVAEIARLNLTPAELKGFSKELAEVLLHFRKLRRLDTGKVEPTFQPVDVRNVTREDAPGKCLSQKEALANAKNKERGFFKGPKVV